MRASTGKTFASFIALGLLAAGAGATGCYVEVPTGPGGDDGGRIPISFPECAPTNATAASVFTRTSGPDVARFRFVAATEKAVFASTGTSLHRSFDGGDTWSLVDAAPLRGAQVQAIASFGDEIFVSIYTNEAAGLFRSTDAGDTWKAAVSENCSTPSYLSSSGGALFAQQWGRTFQWEPTGETWLPLPIGDNGFDVIESDGKYLYANAIYTPGVYRIELGVADAAWTAVTDLPEWGYKAFAFDGLHGFASNSTEIFETVDGGASWKSITTNPEVQDLLVSGGRVFAATFEGLRVSDDGGASWTKLGDEVYSTPFALATAGGHVFTASDALRRATSGDVSIGAWQTLHPIGDSVYGLYATQHAVLSMSDGHLLRSTDGGATWTEVLIGGEVANLSLLVEKDDALFALKHPGSGGVQVLRSTDDGATFEVRGEGPGDGYAWANFLSATDDALVIGLTSGAGSKCQDVHDSTTTLYQSVDDGATWAPTMNNFPTTFTDCYGESYTPGLTGIAQAGDLFFAETFWKGTYRSANGGKTWVELEPDETLGAIAKLVPVDGAIVGIAGKGGLARSNDGGLTWSASGLSGLEVSSLVRAGDVLYATVPSADPAVAGVYTSGDLGITWARVDATFDARVSKVVVQDGKLFAATLDESVWAAPLSCTP